jgi:hypothetical protein
VPFCQFFKHGQDGLALIVWPSRIPHSFSKIIFVLGSYEFLVMLEGKIRETPFLLRFNLVCIANSRDNLFYITLAEKVQSQPFRKGLFCVLTFPVEKVVWDASESTNFKKLLHQPGCCRL